jgi:hypothetical protein
MSYIKSKAENNADGSIMIQTVKNKSYEMNFIIFLFIIGFLIIYFDIIFTINPSMNVNIIIIDGKNNPNKYS